MELPESLGLGSINRGRRCFYECLGTAAWVQKQTYGGERFGLWSRGAWGVGATLAPRDINFTRDIDALVRYTHAIRMRRASRGGLKRICEDLEAEAAGKMEVLEYRGWWVGNL
jgi:hypothetical protein